MTTTKKFDIYQTITDRIIEQLGNGIIPWQQPWTGRADGAYSYTTGKPYSFINQMLLGKPGAYLTFKQIQEVGGKVLKGEKSQMVTFWKVYSVDTGDKDEEGNEITENRFVLRYYRVFHIDQTEGVPQKERPQTSADEDMTAETVKADYLAANPTLSIHNGDDKAYYSPAADRIVVPHIKCFAETAEYYSTLFHEMTHSTGHKSRLNRLDNKAAFGSEVYSKEELTAEIGAASLVNICGLETEKSFRNSAGYIQSWLSALKNDKRLIIGAASRAQKAVDMILGK